MPVAVDIGAVLRPAIGTDVGILAALEPGIESAVASGPHRPDSPAPAPEPKVQALRYKNATM